MIFGGDKAFFSPLPLLTSLEKHQHALQSHRGVKKPNLFITEISNTSMPRTGDTQTHTPPTRMGAKRPQVGAVGHRAFSCLAISQL